MKMKIWGIHKKYPAFSWWENFMGGHISIGPITIFGHNAMMWVVNIRTKRWGYICFTLPSIIRKLRKMGWYFYLSPNATPWASTYYRGSDKDEQLRANIRQRNLGHNFHTSKNWSILKTINHKFEWTRVCAYDIKRFGPKKEMGDYIPDEDIVEHMH